MRKALFAGSFDPITVGHEDIVRRALPLFDHITVAIGNNVRKKTLFDLDTRRRWVEMTFADCPTVSADIYSSATIDYCKDHNINFLIRGIRNPNDLVYEQEIALLNRRLAPEVETVFLLTAPQHCDVSSSAVREFAAFGKDASELVPAAIRNDFSHIVKNLKNKEL